MSQTDKPADNAGSENKSNLEVGKKSVFSGMEESERSKELYRYHVTPNFYPTHVTEEQKMRPTNKRKSTRYNWVSFFPIAFGLQFKKVVNIFYIITGVLNIFPTIRVNSPIAVLVPTALIMLLGVLKEFLGEWKRYQEDKEINATPVNRLLMPGSKAYAAGGGNEPQVESVTLADIAVGDIIRIDDMEQVPADCVLLQVKDCKPEAFVKTAALDGERNLKPKLANAALSRSFNTMFGPQGQQNEANLQVVCINPIKELYYFEGRLKATLPEEGKFIMQLDQNQFLHRGSFIENSGYVYALVVYTGTDSKLIMNLGRYVFKMSTFEKILNRIMVINLLLAIVIALITAGIAIAFNGRHDETWDYLFYEYDPSAAYLINFFRAYLIVNSFVPLDLLAMLEISKLYFTPIMQNDTEMMIKDLALRDVVGFKANTLNLAEELAQVEYIFCDKTGTLTQNELVFRGMTLQKGQELFFQDEKEISEMQQSVDKLGLDGDEKQTFDNFFRCINLCQDCISLKDERKGHEEDLVYNGPSVDEVCLLDMAAKTGIGKFLTRDSETVSITLNGKTEQYGLIKTFEFTSERKAMSVMLQHPTEQKAICFVKGADSSVFPMCTGYYPSQKSELERDSGNDKIREIEKSVERMASKGLRTLLYGMKTIPWDGTRDPVEVDVKEIECDLTLLAATGVEDLLQENVKECIEDFRDAGISVWMLTGDKGLTALEIGVSCGLIPQQRVDISDPNNPGQSNQLEDTALESGNEAGKKVLIFQDDDTDPTQLWEKIKLFLKNVDKQSGFQILISGMVIAVALDSEFMHADLGSLLGRAKSVVVYRSSPAQKAEVVTFMKRYTHGKVTLAIGDGANDVNMIQSADLGFGLMGKEGNQAAAFADYAIPRYKDLRRALFWHGRGYGWRIQYFTIMVLVKSIVNAVAKYGVQFTNGASGIQPVDNILIVGFNILMTNWYVLHYSVFDQEVSFKDYGTLEKEKKLPYTMSALYAYTRDFIHRKRFLKLIFWVDVYSICAGIWIWVVWDQMERSYFQNGDGQIFGLYTYGVFLTMCVVISHHFQVLINTRNFGTYLVFWMIFSISMLPFTLWLAQIMPKSQTLKSTYRTILKSPTMWLMVLMTSFVIVLPLYVNKRYNQVVRFPQFYKV